MGAGPVPLVPWDPTNSSGHVAWKCACVSEADISANGGAWTNNPARQFDTTKGVRITGFTASSYLQFDVRPFLNEAALANGVQFSFEIETSKVISFFPSDPYLQGSSVDKAGNLLVDLFNAGTTFSLRFSNEEGSFNEISGLRVFQNPTVSADEEYRGAVGSYSKNFHTRFIIVFTGRLWQLWVEHQDTNGNRTGIVCLTRSGIDMNPTRRRHGVHYQYSGTTALAELSLVRVFWSQLGATNTAVNTYVRNLQIAIPAPTQIYNPLFRSITVLGDSYAANIFSTVNPPNPLRTNVSIFGPSVGRADHSPIAVAMGKIFHQTGINHFAEQGCHQGGGTLISTYGSARTLGGIANLPMSYITSDNAVPSSVVWSAGMAIIPGDYVHPTPRNGFVYACTVSDGLAGAVQPTFTTTIGTDVSLDGVTYRCINYDQNFIEPSGFMRKGYARPSLLIQLGGFNDSDFIQRNIDTPGSNPVYSGYSYVNYKEMFEDVWKKWIKAILDQNNGVKLIIFTVPASAPNLIFVNGIQTSAGRQEALDHINSVYLAAPAYFQALGTTYHRRVTTVDMKSIGGWNKIGDRPEDYPDDTHPGGERVRVIQTECMYRGITHMMADGDNTVIS